MNLSLAITTFNRFEFTIESFSQVIDDPRIDDIIILDDCSTDGSFEKLVKHFAGIEKVRVMRQAKNRGMSLNKRDAISYARNEWVIIFDSDNIITTQYLNSLKTNFSGIEDIIYCPTFAMPEFDYRKFSGQLFNSQNIVLSGIAADAKFNMALNTCNYLIHRDSYLKTYSHNEQIIASDTIWFNYLWLKNGGKIYFVPGMHYFHRVHNGSGFLKDLGYNMKQAEKIKKMILSL